KKAAHLNPAITLAFALFRDFPKRKVIGYWIVQGVGAFMAAAAVYSLFHSDIDRFDDGHRQVDGPQATGDIFYVTPLSNTSLGKQFILEFLGTLLLVVVICSISDQYNSRDIGALLPIVAGLTLTTLLTCLVYERGASFNPARDLGPRLFTLIFYGIGVFTNHNFYFWVPTVAPLLGAASGCIVYDILVPSTPIDQACHTRSLPSNVLSNAEAGQNGGHHYMGTSTGITVDNDASTC
ncbi:aquaporin-like protein, partial [Syncephalis plumigaleata]